MLRREFNDLLYEYIRDCQLVVMYFGHPCDTAAIDRGNVWRSSKKIAIIHSTFFFFVKFYNINLQENSFSLSRIIMWVSTGGRTDK